MVSGRPCKKGGTSAPIIGGYEFNEIKAALDSPKTIADAFGVTVDFLLGNDDTLMDKKLLQKVEDIKSITAERRHKIYEPLDITISYHKTKKAYSKV